MTKQTEALHKALKVLNCLNNDRVYETAWVKGAINSCEEALEQPAQEPVAWHHYKTFDLIYHDVWEELLEGKDEWYPLDYQENTNLRQVVKNHIEDLRKCIPVLDKYPQMKQTRVEVEKAISELQEALYTHPAPSWQGLSDDEIKGKLFGIRFDRHTHNLMSNPPQIQYSYTITENELFKYARAIEQALKEKNT